MLAELDNPAYVEKLRAALKVHVAERKLELYKPYVSAPIEFWPPVPIE